METVTSHADFLQKAATNEKSFLLLYKSGGEKRNCAVQNFENAIKDQQDVPVYIADVTQVVDIHPTYSITSMPALLIFNNKKLTSVIKGCHDSGYYRALTENGVFQTKAKAEGCEIKRVTVYSTPSCSWCTTLKTWLRNNRVAFTDVDISNNPKAAEDIARRSGQQGVPQTDINGRIVVGFNQQRLKELLEIQ